MIPFADAGPRHQTLPVVAIGLIGLNCLVFLYELQLGGLGVLTGGGDVDIHLFYLKFGFIPEELTAGKSFTHAGPYVIETPLPTWATIVSSMFIHGGFFHLAGNMMFLWVFGNNIEHRWGRLKFLLFYLAAGAAAALSQLAIDPHSQVPMVGASGAVSGVLGAYLLAYPFNRIRALIIFYLVTVVEMRAVWLLGGWFVWQGFQGLASLGVPQAVNVAFFAHIGGFVAGLVLMAVYSMVGPRSGRPALPQPTDYWYQAGRRRS